MWTSILRPSVLRRPGGLSQTTLASGGPQNSYFIPPAVIRARQPPQFATHPWSVFSHNTRHNAAEQRALLANRAAKRAFVCRSFVGGLRSGAFEHVRSGYDQQPAELSAPRGRSGVVADDCARLARRCFLVGDLLNVGAGGRSARRRGVGAGRRANVDRAGTGGHRGEGNVRRWQGDNGRGRRNRVKSPACGGERVAAEGVR